MGSLSREDLQECMSEMETKRSGELHTGPLQRQYTFHTLEALTTRLVEDSLPRLLSSSGRTRSEHLASSSPPLNPPRIAYVTISGPFRGLQNGCTLVRLPGLTAYDPHRLARLQWRHPELCEASSVIISPDFVAHRAFWAIAEQIRSAFP